ncbi:MAG: outer membrane lipoprotein carrier protein LolA [Thermoanaerobaculia bacterium]
MSRRIRRTLRCATLAWLVAPVLLAQSTPDPWTVLSSLRDALAENGPIEVGFTQTFVPAGFTSGDREQGRMALALPDCLRWDYRTPYQKVYLLCGSQVHSWNPGELSGRRYPIDPAEAPGLDLLRMRVDALATRYAAHSSVRPDGTIEVTLDPLQQVADIQSARFELEPDGKRLRELSYEDAEGSRTRFEFSDYRPLGEIELFSPPASLKWEED